MQVKKDLPETGFKVKRVVVQVRQAICLKREIQVSSRMVQLSRKQGHSTEEGDLIQEGH